MHEEQYQLHLHIFYIFQTCWYISLMPLQIVLSLKMRETWTLSLQSQDLIVLAATVRVLSLQQVQAAEPDAFKHSPALVLNASIAVLHAVTSVMFGWGRLEGSQFALISSSQLRSVSVRFVSCEAPLFDFPLQVRLEAFPPPFSTILLTTGPKIPFFPDLLSEVICKNI